MAQQTATRSATGGEHDERITAKFGTPEKLGERFARGVEGLYVVEGVEGADGVYTVERDGSDHVYRTNVRAMECDCGDKKGLCKHLWRVLFETGDIPEIGVNVATNTALDADTRPPTHIVLSDTELEQLLRAAGNLNMADEIAASFEREGDENVGELDADAQKRVIDTVDMACGSGGFDGPTTDAEFKATIRAKEAVQNAEPA